MSLVREIPPPLELECLKALWALGEATVKEVQALLAEDRALAYTTVMTLLDRLVRRGGATRKKQGRAFLYAPLLSRDEMRTLAVDLLVRNLFENSRDQLRLYLEGGDRSELAPMVSEAPGEVLDPSLL